MARVSFSPDKAAPPLDGKLEEIGAQAILAGRPIRLRLQPNLYNTDKPEYQSWTGLAWTIDLESIDEGRTFRVALGEFMAAFGDEAKQAKLLKFLRETL